LPTFCHRNDTKKILVTIQHHFTLHNHITKKGVCNIQLSITGSGERVRINTGLQCAPKDWDPEKERIINTVFLAEQHNLLLDNIVSKITRIKTNFHLNEMAISPKKIAQELQNTSSRLDFLAYFADRIEKERPKVSPGYYRKIKSVLKKLQNYVGEIYFSDINAAFIENYRILLAGKGNKKSTINSNIATIKKILNAADDEGIKFNIKPKDIKVGSTRGNRVDLNVRELKHIYNYYLSPFTPEHWRLTLGYFLFSCFTGIRLGDVLDLERKQLTGMPYVDFTARKTTKRQSIPITQKCRTIIEHDERLFVLKVTPEQMNRNLKAIGIHLKIAKNITFHVGRHTFATNFLRAGGNVVKLQKLLGHGTITMTMIYVHIVEQEANEEINLMDGLF